MVEELIVEEALTASERAKLLSLWRKMLTVAHFFIRW